MNNIKEAIEKEMGEVKLCEETVSYLKAKAMRLELTEKEALQSIATHKEDLEWHRTNLAALLTIQKAQHWTERATIMKWFNDFRKEKCENKKIRWFS